MGKIASIIVIFAVTTFVIAQTITKTSHRAMCARSEIAYVDGVPQNQNYESTAQSAKYPHKHLITYNIYSDVEYMRFGKIDAKDFPLRKIELASILSKFNKYLKSNSISGKIEKLSAGSGCERRL
jgi:hypothetical protein